MTDYIDLDAIQARINAATAEPWAMHSGDYYTIETPEGGLVSESVERHTDADFIAHARQDVPALLAEVRRAHGVIAKARDLIGDKAGDITGAALDAWVLLENAVPKRGSSERDV